MTRKGSQSGVPIKLNQGRYAAIGDDLYSSKLSGFTSDLTDIFDESDISDGIYYFDPYASYISLRSMHNVNIRLVNKNKKSVDSVEPGSVRSKTSSPIQKSNVSGHPVAAHEIFTPSFRKSADTDRHVSKPATSAPKKTKTPDVWDYTFIDFEDDNDELFYADVHTKTAGTDRPVSRPMTPAPSIGESLGTNRPVSRPMTPAPSIGKSADMTRTVIKPETSAPKKKYRSDVWDYEFSDFESDKDEPSYAEICIDTDNNVTKSQKTGRPHKTAPSRPQPLKPEHLFSKLSENTKFLEAALAITCGILLLFIIFVTVTAVRNEHSAKSGGSSQSNSTAAAQADDSLPDHCPRLSLNTHEVIISKGTYPSFLSYIGTLSDDEDSPETLSEHVMIKGLDEFDENKQGTYKIGYYVTDTDNNSSNTEYLEITVH